MTPAAGDDDGLDVITIGFNALDNAGGGQGGKAGQLVFGLKQF